MSTTPRITPIVRLYTHLQHVIQDEPFAYMWGAGWLRVPE